jgi:hypothetical protein
VSNSSQSSVGDSVTATDIYPHFRVLTVDRRGNGEWLPLVTAFLLSEKGLARLRRRNSDATLVLLLDDE